MSMIPANVILRILRALKFYNGCRLSCRPTAINWLMFLIVMIKLPVLASDSDLNLRKALVHVRYETNVTAAEENCAKLLLQYSNSPAAMGKIYLALVLNNAYDANGYTNLIETSQRALQFPLDIVDECQAYESLGSGLRMKMMSGRLSEHEETTERRQILDVYLNALKLILSKATTLQKQEVPGVDAFEFLGSTNDPIYIALDQKQQAQWKAHDETVGANDLVDQFNLFKRNVIELYLGVSYVEEITTEGEKIMPGAPVLKELVEEVKKSNAPPPTSETNSIR